MKQSLGTLVVFGLSLSLHAQTSMDQANSGTYLKAPPAPQYETCGYVTVDNGFGGTYQTQDQACQNRNAEKQRNYNAALEVYNRSTRIMSADASTLTKPAEPVYKNCQVNEVGGGYQMDYACQTENQAKQRDYNIQISAWNRMQEEQAQQNQAQQSEEQRRALAEAQAQSATEALRKAQEQNQKSADKSNKAATITQGISVAFGVAFAGTCAMAGGCVEPLLAASMAFGLMSSQNSRQSGQNKASAVSACQTQAQLNSQSSADCNAVAAMPSGPQPLVPNVFNTNGDCVSADKSICDQIIAGLPTGTNIKDTIKGLNQFATAPPFKVNTDGTATSKNGKTYKPSDFSSKEAMMAAGFSEDQAKAAMAAMAKSGLGKNALDKAKSDLLDGGKDKKTNFGGGAIAGGLDETGPASGLSSGALGSKSIDGSDLGKRNPAGAGLTRDFNGETIGAAGDDIFVMMNRRYKTKTAQDSFISN